MSAYYGAQALNELAESVLCVRSRSHEIGERWVTFQFNSEQAREMAIHGFARRIVLMARCIENVFEILPAESDRIPTGDETDDAEIQIQAFFIHTIGCLDNLAWIWVHEREVKGPDGKPLKREWVGLRTANKYLRQALSPSLREYVGSIELWFKYIEDYRHALAHQIPLYIPPFVVRPENATQFNELDGEIAQLLRTRKYSDMAEAKKRQDGLKIFQPFIKHSLLRSRGIRFHVQMLTDFNTVAEIQSRVFAELKSGCAK